MSTPDMLLVARGFVSRGFSVFPLDHPDDTWVTDPDQVGKTPAIKWKQYQETHPTDADLISWFGNGRKRNVALVTGAISNVVMVDGDSTEGLAWMRAHLPLTPFRTKTAKGEHWGYAHPGIFIKNKVRIRTDDPAIKIDIRGDGGFVVSPGSLHNKGVVYSPVGTWPQDTNLPTFDPAWLESEEAAVPSEAKAKVLPPSIPRGQQHMALFREGCRLRRVGWERAEIADALWSLHRHRSEGPNVEHERQDVEKIAADICDRYTPAVDTFPLTETGDGEFFAACNADTVRYDHRRGRWLLFEGHVWVPQNDGQIARLALQTVRARQRASVGDKDRMRWAIGGESRNRQSNLLALAQNIKPLADAGEGWDFDPWLLAAQNGIIDLRTGTLRPGRAADRITMRVRAAFDPGATCPLYDQTVQQIFRNDDQLIAYFDRYVGYSLTGDCREETLWLGWGSGGNGKTLLLGIIGWLLGDYSDDLPFSAFELHSRAGIPNDIAKIVGKRFVTASETGEAVRLNESRVKALTGRDPITARFLHKEFFTFQVEAKFWLATNHKPDVRDDSEGFWRRLHLIPFTASFIDKPDKTLKDRLREEASGILARAVRGCLDWQRDGLNPPKAVLDASRTYRADSKPLARFLNECCIEQEGARATFGALFKAYCQWTGRDAGGRMGRHEFSEALRAEFDVDSNNTRNVTFLGVGLVDLGI